MAPLGHPNSIPMASLAQHGAHLALATTQMGKTRQKGARKLIKAELRAGSPELHTKSPASYTVFRTKAAEQVWMRQKVRDSLYLLHSSTRTSRSSLLGFFWRS